MSIMGYLVKYISIYSDKHTTKSVSPNAIPNRQFQLFLGAISLGCNFRLAVSVAVSRDIYE